MEASHGGAQSEGGLEELTTLVGREVYTNNGVYVGEVEDVRLDVGAQAVTGLALGEINADLLAGQLESGQRGAIVPYRWVRNVGDVVIVSDVVERLGVEDDDVMA
ncbi:PRC-barrel domain-containing protein [Salinarchaeum chitinilyticum]